MANTVGAAQLEIGADVSGVEAGVTKAKKSISGLGDAAKTAGKEASQGFDKVGEASARTARSIDNYVKRLELSAATVGKSVTEAKLFELSQRGASAAQLKSAESALKAVDAYNAQQEAVQRISQRQIEATETLKKYTATVATAAVVAGTAFAAAFKQSIDALDRFNDLADATGSSIENISALDRVARQTGGTFETASSTLIKFNQILNKTDEDSADAARVLGALGLDAEKLKKIDPAEALRQTAVALSQFADDGNKARAVQILFGKSIAEAAPFLKDLSEQTQLVSVTNAKAAQDAEALVKRFSEMKANVQDVARAIAVSLSPAIIQLSNEFLEGMKRANGFVDAILTFGTINPFRTQAGNLKALRSELDGLEEDRQRYVRAGSDTRAIDQAIAKGKRQYDYLKALQAGNAVASTAGDDLGDAISRRLNRPVSAPSLKVPGKADKAKDTSRADAMAQAKLDIALIKQASEERVNIYVNSERILEAQRQAGLLSESEYWDAKRAFLNLNAQAQIDALNAENARLQQEKLNTKDSLDRDRQVSENQTKIAKLQNDLTTNQIVLDMQSTAAIKAKESALLTATQAAQAYLDVQIQQQQRDLEGIGQGRSQREFNTGLNQIADRYAGQRVDLANQRALLEFEGKFTEEARKQYEARLAIINDYEQRSIAASRKSYDEKIAKESDWSLGAREALKNYQSDAANIYTQVDQVVSKSFQGMEDALVKFVTTGKLSFTDLANSIVTDITRIIIKQQISNALGVAGSGGGQDLLMAGINYLMGGAVSTGSSGSSTYSLSSGSSGLGLKAPGARAVGGPVSSGGMYQVNEKGPELLSVGGKQYLMMGNESGQVTPNDRLGAGSGSTVINVTVPMPSGANRSTALQFGRDVAKQLSIASTRNG